MLKLILFRHAKAEPSDDDLDDFARVLADQGRTDAPLVGAHLASKGHFPDTVVVSPAARTRETWSLIETCFPSASVSFPTELYLAPAMDLLRHAEQSAAEAVMVVAHNPGLHDLATLMARGDSKQERRLREGFPTSAAAVLVRKNAKDLWTLADFVTPKDLRG